MNNFGLVSIITPTYNCSKYIGDAIESVLAQTYTNWEMLITDDSSTDETVSVIQAYANADDRIKLFTLNENSGAGVARNNSIGHASGRFIAFLDADDMWVPEKLERQLAFMAEHDAALAFSSYMVCDEEGKSHNIVIAKNKVTLFQDICDNKIGFSTAVYDTAKVGKVYMPAIRKRQDWALGLLILQKCKVAYGQKQTLAYYRKRQESLSSNKLSLIKYHIMVYVVVLGWSKFMSALFFFFVYMPAFAKKRLVMRFVNNY